MEITIENLTKRFGDQIAVNNLFLKIPAGKIYGFIGANGAGKTTTMKMMVGLLKPDSGVVRYNGKEMKHLESSIMQDVGVIIRILHIFSEYLGNLLKKQTGLLSL